jgi:hypothetical protein
MEKQINAVQDFHRRIDAGVAHRPCLLCHCEESAREFAIAIRELCEQFANHSEGRYGRILPVL